MYVQMHNCVYVLMHTYVCIYRLIVNVYVQTYVYVYTCVGIYMRYVYVCTLSIYVLCMLCLM